MAFWPGSSCTDHPEAEQHRSQLKLVFGRIQDHGLISSPAKCQFGLPVLHFLGHWSLAKGLVPLPFKVQVGAGFPHPSSVKSPDEGPMRGHLSPRWFKGRGCVLDVELLKSSRILRFQLISARLNLDQTPHAITVQQFVQILCKFVLLLFLRSRSEPPLGNLCGVL